MTGASRSDDTSALARRFGAGDLGAAEALQARVGAELRRLAGAYMAREAAGHTLQPTALVNEAWLQLCARSRARGFVDRSHFVATAALAMRHALAGHARRRFAQRRGGGARRVTLELDHLADASSAERTIDAMALDEALSRLSELSPRQAQTFMLRGLGGLTIAEAADVLGVSTTTIENDWTVARAFLRRALAIQPRTDERD